MCDLSRCVGGSQGNEGTVPSFPNFLNKTVNEGTRGLSPH